MLEKLIQLQDRFQPFLKDRDYSFIGPVDQSLLEPFMRRANDLAPIVSINREVRHFLSHRAATLQALDIFPTKTQLRIYIVDGRSDDILLHDTIENYCTKHNIEFEI